MKGLEVVVLCVRISCALYKCEFGSIAKVSGQSAWTSAELRTTTTGRAVM